MTSVEVTDIYLLFGSQLLPLMLSIVKSSFVAVSALGLGFTYYTLQIKEEAKEACLETKYEDLKKLSGNIIF